MKDALIAAGFSFSEHYKVWSHSHFRGIGYNDGEEIEERLHRVIVGAQDVSLFSQELREAQIDWPSFYHLASCRANVLRPFESRLQGAQVLEIGAGCGAITRYLGETGAEVLALEGAVRRAQIARERTRELSNVVVVSENFQDFDIPMKFDVVTLIGVLEYAPLFMRGDSPVVAMLHRAREFLKPDGVLVVAIENKLGLKYFAGAPEDHTGREMDGIESRYKQDGPVTFGYRELHSLLGAAGYSNVEFLAALPDYKAPVSIITPTAFDTPDFDVASLVAGSFARDRQLPSALGFSLDRAWRAVVANQLGMDLANSFIVAASTSEGSVLEPEVLAYHYNSNRISCLCKSTVFYKASADALGVKCQRLDRGVAMKVSLSRVSQNLSETEQYQYGDLLSEECAAIFAQEGWTIAQVVDFIISFLTWLETEGAERVVSNHRVSGSVTIDGRYFDALPQNVVVLASGEKRLIDTEWSLNQAIPVEQFVFRLLLAAINFTSFFEKSGSEFDNSRMGFMSAVFGALGIPLSVDEIRCLGAAEAQIQSEILGAQLPDDFWSPTKQLTPLRNAFDKARHLEYVLKEVRDELKVVRDSRDQYHNQLADVTRRLTDVEGQLVLSRDTVESLRKALQAVSTSMSWRATAPFRLVAGVLRRVVRN